MNKYRVDWTVILKNSTFYIGFILIISILTKSNYGLVILVLVLYDLYGKLRNFVLSIEVLNATQIKFNYIQNFRKREIVCDLQLSNFYFQEKHIARGMYAKCFLVVSEKIIKISIIVPSEGWTEQRLISAINAAGVTIKNKGRKDVLS